MFRLVATYDPSPDSHVVVRFGLNERCERVTVFTPEPDHDSDPVVEVLECRPFPFGVRDGCKHPGTLVCAAWTSAQYFSELGCWCAGAALVALLFGVSTHSRRQRVWRAVAGLVLMHGASFSFLFFFCRRRARSGLMDELWRGCSVLAIADLHADRRALSNGTVPCFRARQTW